MKKIINQHSLTFIVLNVYISLLILLPKSISTIGIIPVRLLLMIIMIAVILFDVYNKKISFNKSNIWFLVIIEILFLIFTIPSFFKTYSLLTTIYTFLKFLASMILFNLILKIKLTKEELTIIFKKLIICIFIVCVYSIIEYVFDINLFKIGVEYYEGAKGRVAVGFFNTIYFSVFINAVYPICLYALLKVKEKKMMIIMILVLSLLYISLLLTFTRSAILVFFMMFFIMLVFLRKEIFKLRTLVVICTIILTTVSIPGAIPLSNKAFRDGIVMLNKVSSFIPNFNIGGNGSSDDDTYVDFDHNSEFVDFSLQHREMFAKIAKQIGNDNLYTGIGFGAYMNYMESEDFDFAYPEYKITKTHPHSTLSLMYAEISVIAIIFFCLWYFTFSLKLFKTFLINFKKNNDAYQLSVIGLTIIGGFGIVNFISENVVYDTQLFPIFLILIGLIISLLNNDTKEEL